MNRKPGLLLVGLLIGIDQASKTWVESALPFQTQIDIMPLLSFFRTWNTGIAFSFLAGLSDHVLVGLTLTIIGFVIWLWARSSAAQFWARLGFAFVTGGAFGNLVDRLRHGHVVDFILFHARDWSFAVFNLADSFITIGAILILLDEFIGARRTNKINGEAPNG